MRRDEGEIGHVYLAKATGKWVSVRIEGQHGHGGWNATNLTTGKKVHIKSAQRLRGGMTADDARPEEVEAAPSASDPPRSPKAGKGGKKAPKATGRTKGKKAATRAQEAEPEARGPSALDAAARVLEKAGRPLTDKEIVQLAA